MCENGGVPSEEEKERRPSGMWVKPKQVNFGNNREAIIIEQHSCITGLEVRRELRGVLCLMSPRAARTP